MPNFSKPSTPVYKLDLKNVTELSCEFFYNFYLEDESVEENAGVPEDLRTKSVEQINTSTVSFNLRVPRFITVNWKPVPNSFSFSSIVKIYKPKSIRECQDDVTSEDNFLTSKFIPYAFSGVEKLEEAYDIIKKSVGDNFESSATSTDRFVKNLLEKSVETGDTTKKDAVRSSISTAIKNIEKIADRPSDKLGYAFFDRSGKQIKDTSGFDQAVSGAQILHSQINSFVVPDVFVSASLSTNSMNDLNNYYEKSKKNFLNVDDENIKPIFVGERMTEIFDASAEMQPIGYIVDRYESMVDGFQKQKTFYIENPNICQFTDISIKYGAVYYYSVRTVYSVISPAYDEDSHDIRKITYYVCSRPEITHILCEEHVPPPPPVDVNFVWNYREGKLRVVWGMPVNSQRDIKQFQIFRRSSIKEPFELLQQKCFDYSKKKYTTGEAIDGNSSKMTKEESSYVKIEKSPLLSYVDEDFTTDVDLQRSSKYIYTIVSVDAHGMVSNYSSQVEVTFDFFKNVLSKKLISVAGAPRQYPNMYLNMDLFKDVIKASGPASTKMEVYFMPEYFKLAYSDRIEKVLFTEQDNAYYKLQFINLQNQKSDSLKINIKDPNKIA